MKHIYLTIIMLFLGLNISLAFATISVSQIKAQTISGLDGTFSLSLPEGQHKVSISMVDYRRVDTLINRCYMTRMLILTWSLLTSKVMAIL